MSFLDALRSALPEIRAVLPDGHRFDVTFIDASTAMTEIGGWCSPPERCRELTPRQEEILDLLATGLSNKEIGRKLALSHFTIRNHISQIMRLLKVSSRQEVAAALALFEHQSSSNVESGQVQRQDREKTALRFFAGLSAGAAEPVHRRMRSQKTK